jgi:hypothetical protein
MDTSKIAMLKETMNKATSFYRVWDYFFDHIAEDPELLAAGRPVEDKILEELVTRVAPSCMEKPPRVFGLLLIEIPGADFIHGIGRFDGCAAAVFYFKDMGVGMLAVIGPDGKSSRIARFVGVVVECRKPPVA